MQIGDLVQLIKANGYIKTGIIIKGPYHRGAPMPHPELFGVSNEFYTVLWTNGHKEMIRKNQLNVISSSNKN